MGQRYKLFALFWGGQTILEMGKWGEMLSSPLQLLVFASAIFVCLHPGSTARLLLLAMLQVGVSVLKMPWLTNHTLLNTAANVTLIATFVQMYWFDRKGIRRVSSDWAADWCTLFSPLLRTELLIVYAWASFHKLNIDWFDTERSCAVIFWDRMVRWTPWADGLRPIGVVMPYLALLTEFLLPILLARPKWRFWGVLFGLCFHALLGLVGFYRFSAIVTALYCLFLPDWIVHSIDQLYARASDTAGSAWGRSVRFFGGSLGVPLERASRVSWRSVLTWMVCFASLLVLTRLRFVLPEQPMLLVREQILESRGGWSMLFQTAWFAVTFLSMVTLCMVYLRVNDRGEVRSRLDESVNERGATAALGWLWIFPVLVFVNGAAPYLGLKTEASFSMFSNLRTAGERSNHLLVRRPLQLLVEGTDLVEIILTSDRELTRVRDGNYLIPWMELCSYIQEKVRRGDTFDLKIRRNGVIGEYPSVRESRDAFGDPSWWVRKWTWFRTVNTDPVCPCMH